jgi:hypothetical protein
LKNDDLALAAKSNLDKSEPKKRNLSRQHENSKEKLAIPEKVKTDSSIFEELNHISTPDTCYFSGGRT